MPEKNGLIAVGLFDLPVFIRIDYQIISDQLEFTCAGDALRHRHMC